MIEVTQIRSVNRNNFLLRIAGKIEFDNIENGNIKLNIERGSFYNRK